MKTNQKLEISYQGMIFAQDMHKKMIYVNELEIEILKQTGLLDKRFNIFMTRKDTKEFIKVLKVSENLQDEEIIYGRGKTKRIHHLLAFKFATWVSKEFEIKVYKFFLEEYPKIRELGGDKYNEFRDKFLPKIYNGDVLPELPNKNEFTSKTLSLFLGKEQNFRENDFRINFSKEYGANLLITGKHKKEKQHHP